MNASEDRTYQPAAAPPAAAAAQVPVQPGDPPGLASGTAEQVTSAFRREPKVPVLACFLSLMPGLGQVYVGYYQRGFIHAIIVAVMISILAQGRPPDVLVPLMGLFLAFFWLYNIIDAGRRAAYYNHMIQGGESFELPQDFKTPRFHGSIGLGAVMIVIGVALLANTRFAVPLDWVEEWWPVGVIAFGGWLIYRAWADRGKE